MENEELSKPLTGRSIRDIPEMLNEIEEALKAYYSLTGAVPNAIEVDLLEYLVVTGEMNKKEAVQEVGFRTEWEEENLSICTRLIPIAGVSRNFERGWRLRP